MDTERKGLRVDCSKLEGLMKLLHKKTTVDDLEPEELFRVFPELREKFEEYNKLKREILIEPGGVLRFAAVQDPLDQLGEEFREKRLSTIYLDHCQEES